MTVTNIKEMTVYGISLDPIHIGTWWYSIWRVDNTIVRDTITNVPKIPWTSMAGNWRYYVALMLQDKIWQKKPKFEEIKVMKENTLEEKLEAFQQSDEWNKIEKDWYKYYWNLIAKIQCAWQDDKPNLDYDNPDEKTWHCGHCIVCKSFGYSKSNKSYQWRVFVSDMNILFFPVFTYLWVKWISCERTLKDAWIIVWDKLKEIEVNQVLLNWTNETNSSYINLWYLNLPIQKDKINLDLSGIDIELKTDIEKNLIIVPNDLLSQIVNANLEVRTSVSIDPITWAGKAGALFTSESCPRLTVFYGNVRVNDDYENKITPDMIESALKDSSAYFEVLWVGGMSTRWFGRLKVNCTDKQ